LYRRHLAGKELSVKKLFWIFLLFIPITLTGSPDDFRNYWYKGKAELTRYSLEQARYGEIHKGEAVLIFVTEPFLKDKQVKDEKGGSPNSLSVLKLNLTKRFWTGIYPYSLMTSTFTPVDYKKNHTLKVASSTTEWCGITYTQLNFRNNGYQATSHSYFEDEADQDLSLKSAWLEDEIWTRLRLAPETLPVGDVEVIPSLQFVRLAHVKLQVEPATAQMKKEGDVNTYTLQYKNLKRTLTIHFDSTFPYAIRAWEEKVQGGFGPNSPMLTTKAVKTNTLLLDYWNHHNNKDDLYRDKLGITLK
jgi:hypothetical protein